MPARQFLPSMPFLSLAFTQPAQGDVSVIANGDINVNGSRIITYDGGNITVESLNGSVNVGTGASTPVSVTGYYENPMTLAVYSDSPQLPFSGIVALTFPARDAFYPAPPSTLGNILVEAPNGDINANVAGILQIPLNHLNYPDAISVVLAGYELLDSMGNPVTADDITDGTPDLVSADQNINVNGSGIIASNARLDASGNINGLIFARNNIDINAQQNVNVTALGVGNVNVSSSAGTISGTIVGVGSVSVSGSSIDASLVSANVSGATSGQSGLGQGTAANATSQAASSLDANQAVASSDQSDDDDKKKKKKEVALAQKVGRVTVILPAKSSPPRFVPKANLNPTIITAMFVHPLFAANAAVYAIQNATTEGKITVIALLVLSLFSWTIIITKFRQLSIARKATKKVLCRLQLHARSAGHPAQRRGIRRRARLPALHPRRG